MAYYKYPTYLNQFNDAMFDAVYSPGESVTYAGIYRCEGCGKETSHNSGVPLPPQNHHQHSPAQGSIRWKLIVWAVTH